ncbi:MAG: hypothetical protein H6737_24190 [Alphaproteobacteria bacterium]|nr:hypothetical protein [Alphaproteobacteria bacterium]
MAHRASLEQARPRPGAWWDLWHYHADWPGWGNQKWRYRVEHIRALCVVYRSILDQSEDFKTPFQTWISLDEEDAGQDATFLHTPNRNGTPFPVALDIAWGPSPLEPLFAHLLPDVHLAFGTLGPDTGRLHIVWAPGFGVPLDGDR